MTRFARLYNKDGPVSNIHAVFNMLAGLFMSNLILMGLLLVFELKHHAAAGDEEHAPVVVRWMFHFMMMLMKHQPEVTTRWDVDTAGGLSLLLDPS